MRLINKVIIHCSATKEEKDFRAKDVKVWHLQREFNDIGYHYVIDLDGTVENGRNIAIIGAHTQGYNQDSIGICYIGGLDAANSPKDTRTKEQKISLIKLIKDLTTNLQAQGNKAITVYGHHDFNKNKSCPCFNAKEEYKDLNVY